MDVFLLILPDGQLVSSVHTSWRAAHTAMIISHPALTRLTTHSFVSHDEEVWRFANSGDATKGIATIQRLPLSGGA